MSPLAIARPVPNVVGETRVGDTIVGISPNSKRVSGFTLLAPTRILKLTVACDGAGGAAPTLRALLRGVVYQGNVLLGVGDEVAVMSGDALSWFDLPFTGGLPNGVSVAAGAVELGVLVGGDGGVLRIAQIEPQAPGSRTNLDTYADGPSNPFGVATTLTAAMSIFGTFAADWTPRPNEPVELIARMGFPDAQRLLDVAGAAVPTELTTTAMWHGTSIDGNRGSFAVVLSSGAFGGFVGQRLRVTSKTHASRSVVVYVVASVSALDQEISLARRAFAALDLLTADTLDVNVEVLGP